MNDKLPEITLSPEILDFTTKITTRAVESAEEFIFQTIAPFCERITEQRISKAELTDALMKQKARKPLGNSYTKKCPVCGAGIYRGEFVKPNYCGMCGQKIDFEGGGADE